MAVPFIWPDRKIKCNKHGIERATNILIGMNNVLLIIFLYTVCVCVTVASSLHHCIPFRYGWHLTAFKCCLLCIAYAYRCVSILCMDFFLLLLLSGSEMAFLSEKNK